MADWSLSRDSSRGVTGTVPVSPRQSPSVPVRLVPVSIRPSPATRTRPPPTPACQPMGGRVPVRRTSAWGESAGRRERAPGSLAGRRRATKTRCPRGGPILDALEADQDSMPSRRTKTRCPRGGPRLDALEADQDSMPSRRTKTRCPRGGPRLDALEADQDSMPSRRAACLPRGGSRQFRGGPPRRRIPNTLLPAGRGATKTSCDSDSFDARAAFLTLKASCEYAGPRSSVNIRTREA